MQVASDGSRTASNRSGCSYIPANTFAGLMMRLLARARRATRGFVTMILVMGLAVASGVTAAEPARSPHGTGTLKERLGDKASDEQRVDNCHVPPERWGTKPRPNCAERERSGAAGSNGWPDAGERDAAGPPPAR